MASLDHNGLKFGNKMSYLCTLTLLLLLYSALEDGGNAGILEFI